MKQRDAVYQALENVVGQWDGVCTPTKEQRATVNAILFEGFRAGTIELSREYDDTDLKGYCSGLLSNWLRKDSRLNGGVKYEPKNPGSRAGSKDPTIVAMRLLLSSGRVADETERTKIQTMIDARVAAIKPKTVTINVADLPEELKYLIK
jgi:hypothetical protein